MTSERLAEIVAAAEVAARKVIDEAEDEARRQLADAQAEADGAFAERVASLSIATDSLIAQAEEIRRRSDRLLEALELVRGQLAEANPGERPANGFSRRRTDPDPAPPAPRTSHLSAVESFEAPVAPLGVAPGPEQVPEPEPLVRHEPTAPAPRNSQAHPVRESPAGARLLATQMAVSGSSREEIAARLRNGFEIEDTDAILDAILGVEE